MSLRSRLLLALILLTALLAALGAGGLILLDRMSERIDAILKENYASVRAMFQMNEDVERIDSSFQFALSGKEKEAKKQYLQSWAAFEKQYTVEAANVTIHPAEDRLVDRLKILKDDYRARGIRFYARQPGSPARGTDYYGTPGDPGLLGEFLQIKEVSAEITRINQENMESARDDARATARAATIGFGVGLCVAVVLVGGIAWYFLRTILVPIQAVTAAAEAVGKSAQLDHQVPVFGTDELGKLARAFNSMTSQLQAFRRSNLARMVRVQQTAQATIDSFPDPVLVLDPDGRVELANPAARQVLGVSPSGEGQPGPEWQPPEPLRQPVLDALRSQRPTLTEVFDQAVAFRLGGEDRAFLPQIRPIRDPVGDTLGAAVVLNDVTRFRLLDQFKTDLVATVSHELKTPLTSVRLAVHVLLEETVGPLTSKQTELLIDARDSAERLLALTDQLLALARLQRPQDQGQPRSEDPAGILRKAADIVRARADDKHVQVVVSASEPLPQIAVDLERMELAVRNLLENAVTYTPAGGSVTLTAAALKGSRVEISVADTGVGIPPEYLSHVFDRFFRVPGQSDPAGTGLGLAIVKEIVTAHRGEVTCESSPDRGTTFRITLPASPTEGGTP
ncbi:sensor histidine kinase [Fimbriiglobus ruber]|uniref:histidine kinase n=1 Tax=Fimbriiglobus ruber TaxID=1908690 RepID=A0A225E129_9BACT|nr:HAMP domain-containing sensor histidine kinase [Fimbriiglobus ruber]OWK47292.1 Phosphate regulon sensor protein PhoR (SphS) [Fimbriiglobus ruber]